VGKIERAIDMYSISIRDYFSTFGVYSTVTSIVLTAVAIMFTINPAHSGGAGEQRRVADCALVLFCLGGIWICLQWFVATNGMRWAYRYYLQEIERLQEQNPDKLIPLFNPRRDKYPWFATVHLTLMGTRGASLPIVFALMFGMLILYVLFPGIFSGDGNWIVSATVVLVFSLLNWIAWRLRQKWKPPHPQQ
jgi:hypothetical protein